MICISAPDIFRIPVWRIKGIPQELVVCNLPEPGAHHQRPVVLAVKRDKLGDREHLYMIKVLKPERHASYQRVQRSPAHQHVKPFPQPVVFKGHAVAQKIAAFLPREMQ